jgi:hypothetical protein
MCPLCIGSALWLVGSGGSAGGGLALLAARVHKKSRRSSKATERRSLPSETTAAGVGNRRDPTVS